MSSKASSDPPVDLEKGTAELKAAAIEEEEEQVIVKPRLALCIKVTLDVLVTVYSLFFLGVIVWMVKVSDNWWDPWPAVLFVIAVLSSAFWITPLVKKMSIRRYAMKGTVTSDSDVTTKLLAFKK